MSVKKTSWFAVLKGNTFIDPSLNGTKDYKAYSSGSATNRVLAHQMPITHYTQRAMALGVLKELNVSDLMTACEGCMKNNQAAHEYLMAEDPNGSTYLQAYQKKYSRIEKDEISEAAMIMAKIKEEHNSEMVARDKKLAEFKKTLITQEKQIAKLTKLVENATTADSATKDSPKIPKK